MNISSSVAEPPPLAEGATGELPEKSRMLNPHNEYKECQQLKATSVSGTNIHTLGPIRAGS